MRHRRDVLAWLASTVALPALALTPDQRILLLGGKSNSKVLPSGALGVWNAANYVASPRQTIPNSITNGPTDPNLLAAPRRQFSNAQYWQTSNFTSVTDANTLAPDGSNDATTLIAAGSANWSIQPKVQPFAFTNGQTYTIALSVISLSGSQNFKLGVSGNATLLTATTSWQRFTFTFTAAGSAFIEFITPDGTQACNMAICDFQLYHGASDLNTTWASLAPQAVRNGDLVLGTNVNDNSINVTGGAVIHGCFGNIQLPAPRSLTAYTVMYIAKSVAAPSFAGYQPIVAQATVTNSHGTQNFTTFMAGPQTGTNVGCLYSTVSPDKSFDNNPQINTGLWGGSGGKFVAAHRYDGATSSSFINSVKLLDYPIGALTAPTISDLMFMNLGQGFLPGYDTSILAIWSRALTDAEVATAGKVLSAMTTGLAAPRTICFAGTSITLGAAGTSSAYTVGSNLSPVGFGANYGAGGSLLSSWVSVYAPYLDAIMVQARALAPSQKMILVVEIGANDLGVGAPYAGNPTGFVTNLAAFLAARAASGWLVAVRTILARLDQADGGTQFLADRAVANPLIIALGYPTTDWASDATMGTDTAPNNATLFTSKLHPTTTGYTYLEPYDQTIINAM